MTESTGKLSKLGVVERMGLWLHRSSTDRWYPAKQDAPTGALITIGVFHHEIHEGEAFICSYKAPDASPLADNASIVYHIAPGDKYAHLVFTGACGGDAEIEFSENPTITGGIACTEFNMNRNYPDVADTVVLRDPTINAVGTLVANFLLPGGTGGTSSGGVLGLRANSEFILDPGRTYMVRLTNRAGNAQPASLAIEWYEESDL